jgi:hypothetical protein
MDDAEDEVVKESGKVNKKREWKHDEYEERGRGSTIQRILLKMLRGC